MDYDDEGYSEKTDELGLPKPTEAKKKVRRFSTVRWVIIILVIIYFLLTTYRVPLLMQLGKYLIVEHKASKADVIVCVAGEDVERGLAAVDLYRRGLAPYIFRAKEEKPDGFDYLKEKVEDYPGGFDLFSLIVRGFDIPDKAILTADERVDSTIDEASLVRRVVLERGFKSVIITTSLTHSRRTWLTFKKVFKDDEVKLTSLPSHYQKFDPKDWWKKRRYLRDVIIEYQKLIYYKIAYVI
jgi:uncharacterized SAM-binding protein YcdF (DUF218 family)